MITLSRNRKVACTPEMTAKDIAAKVQAQYESPIVAAYLDNVVRDLQTPLSTHSRIEFVELDSNLGWRIYRRTLIFLLITAVHELFPAAEVLVRFSVNRGIYCDIKLPDSQLTKKNVADIEAKMRLIISENRPIIRRSVQRDEAVALFKKSKQIEKANLIASLTQPEVNVYYCGDFYDYLYGAMLGETGGLGKFKLDFFSPGILLRGARYPGGKVQSAISQPKFGQVVAGAKQWAGILHCNYIADLNRAQRHGQIPELIRISEALQEKEIANIADHITRRHNELRIILIAGPSSSGKTSFAQRLRVQLMVNGLCPIALSLDDYFIDREKAPRNEHGQYDFESLSALDVALFNEHMTALMAGREVIVPRYNFFTGCREWDRSTVVTVAPGQPIIIEGIHGLNEKLTPAITREQKYKIYINALVQLNIDAHNRISTTDTRLVRRIVRDSEFRGYSALRTLRQWPKVRDGEEKNIFPFQEEADVMFNSALIYELGILKRYVEPLLREVPPEGVEYSKAQQLLDWLKYFAAIDSDYDVPNNSLLREFIGGSVFFPPADKVS